MENNKNAHGITESKSMNLMFLKPEATNGGCVLTLMEKQSFVSLYLKLEKTSNLRGGWKVNAEFKLFVFDRINKKVFDCPR
ncbi:hypothetical protein OIU85_011728 [Salix viminalis]|uniref:MATH domain-containing protein n=1 Tax=Salix viminalis TaxID=40686 RepID=A0A9Q0NTF2_SALVM|nr:hypothetical protein OIU85_011728 [Salix viminalis]